MSQRSRTSVAVIGMGIEGGSLARYFLKQGADVTVHHWMPVEDLVNGEQLGPQYHELEAAGVDFRTGDEYLTGLTKHDVVGILQSAFTYKYPENRAALGEVQDLGIPLVTNLSIFFERCPAPIIGVTGTNGKSTTTEMVAGVLQRGPRQIWAGGNLGASPLDVLGSLTADDLVILELSNYQLEFLKKSPWIAAVTNIAPDHLVDYDGDYEAYMSAKRRILDFQSPGDWAVLNQDDPITRTWLKGCAAQPFPFSRQELLECGAFVRDDRLVVAQQDSETTIVPVNALSVLGAHNVENALCATAIGTLAGISGEDIASALIEYTPGEHRLELVGEWSGVQFWNDSKSTTPSSTVAAVQSFPRGSVILLVGGRDKGLPWDELAQTVNHSCKEAIVFSEARHTLERAFLSADAASVAGLVVKKCVSLDEAVEVAVRDAERGDVILLSPACTSFDAFQSYAERGRHFKELVRNKQ